MTLKEQVKIGCYAIAIVLLYPVILELEVIVIYLTNENANLSIFERGYIGELVVLVIPSIIIITIIPKILYWYISYSNLVKISPKGIIYLMVGFSLLSITFFEIIVTLINYFYKLQGTHAIFRENVFDFYYLNLVEVMPELSLRFFNIIISILIINRGKNFTHF